MKTLLLVLGIPLLLIFAFIVYLSWPWLLLYIGLQLGPNPPQPEITYGEFPFRLEYEINGELKVVEDTLICEFDGFGADTGRGGKYRKWKERLASGNERITLLKVDNNKEIEFFPGSPEYYMGDSDNGRNDSLFPNALYFEKDSTVTRSGFVEAKELLDKYDIKLISWNPSPPIKNNFK